MLDKKKENEGKPEVKMYKSLKKGFFNNRTPIPKDKKKIPKVLPANLRQ